MRGDSSSLEGSRWLKAGAMRQEAIAPYVLFRHGRVGGYPRHKAAGELVGFGRAVETIPYFLFHSVLLRVVVGGRLRGHGVWWRGAFGRESCAVAQGLDPSYKGSSASSPPP